MHNKTANTSSVHNKPRPVPNLSHHHTTTFKKVFIANGLAAHDLKKKSGKNSYCYEIRYRANGYSIIVSSTDLQKAKAKFLAKTTPGEIEKYFIGSNSSSQNFSTLEQFTLYFFETHRKNKVTPQTYKCDAGRLKNYIFPTLRKMPLNQITPDKCQALLASIKQGGKGKTADEIYSLLSIIFKGAIAYSSSTLRIFIQICKKIKHLCVKSLHKCFIVVELFVPILNLNILL